MRIRTTVKSAILLTGGLMLMYGIYSIYINRTLEVRVQDLRTSAEVRNLFDRLQDLTQDYFLYRTQRADEQWRIIHGELLLMLDSQRYQEFRRRHQTEDLKSRLGSMSDSYNRLIASAGQNGFGRDETSQEYQNRLITQITLSSREIGSSLDRISKDLRAEVLALQYSFNLINIIALILVASCIIGIARFLSKSVVEPVVKLHEGAETIGRGNLDFRVEPSGPGEIQELAQGFNQMAASLGNLTATLRKSQDDLRYLAAELISAQEKERQFIGLELHDDLGQLLTVLKMQLRGVQKGLPAEAMGVRDEMENALSFVNEIVERMRRLSRSLRPTVLEDIGLSTGLKLLFDDFRKYHGLELNVDMDDIEKLFPWEKQILIYRIFQESLTNIAKHAGATAATITIKQRDGGVDFQMQDNGCGFDLQHALEKSAERRGLGLAAVYERVRMLGGDLQLWSQPGQGTRLRFTVSSTGQKLS